MLEKTLIKKIGEYKTPKYNLSQAYLDLVKKYFESDKNYSNEELQKFFSALRNCDYRTRYKELFRVEMNDNMESAGRFSFNKYNLEEQYLIINPSTACLDENLRKSLLYFVFLHETEHEIQFDRIFNYAVNNQSIETELDKCMYVCMHYSNLLKIPHDFQLQELLANMNAFNLFWNLIEQKVIPADYNNLLFLSSKILYVLNNINLKSRRHVNSSNFIIGASKLVKYYSDKFKYIQFKEHYLGAYQNELVGISFSDINLNEVRITLNLKIENLYDILEQAFLKFLEFYTPSKFIEFKFNIKDKNKIFELWNSADNLDFADLVIRDALVKTNLNESKRYKEKIERINQIIGINKTDKVTEEKDFNI